MSKQITIAKVLMMQVCDHLLCVEYVIQLMKLKEYDFHADDLLLLFLLPKAIESANRRKWIFPARLDRVLACCIFPQRRCQHSLYPSFVFACLPFSRSQHYILSHQSSHKTKTFFRLFPSRLVIRSLFIWNFVQIGYCKNRFWDLVLSWNYLNLIQNCPGYYYLSLSIFLFQVWCGAAWIIFGTCDHFEKKKC